jgi:hypothetical protein
MFFMPQHWKGKIYFSQLLTFCIDQGCIGIPQWIFESSDFLNLKKSTYVTQPSLSLRTLSISRISLSDAKFLALPDRRQSETLLILSARRMKETMLTLTLRTLLFCAYEEQYIQNQNIIIVI